MLRYYITDRQALGGATALLKNIERLGSSIDYLQIREKDLEARALAALTREVLRIAHPHVRVLVNDRADIAIACGAHGVHLRGDALPAHELRAILPPEFVISVSCHNLRDVHARASEGAHLLLLAPIFVTPNKGPALGLNVLAAAARSVPTPVLALGGIHAENTASCFRAGAAGIAAIRLFQQNPAAF